MDAGAVFLFNTLFFFAEVNLHLHTIGKKKINQFLTLHGNVSLYDWSMNEVHGVLVDAGLQSIFKLLHYRKEEAQLHIGRHVNNTEGNIKIWNSSQQPLHYDAMLL